MGTARCRRIIINMKRENFFSPPLSKVIPSQATVFRDLYRTAFGFSALQFCVVYRQYWYALGIVLVDAVFRLATEGYVLFRFPWYRRWVFWIAVVTIACTALALKTKVIWISAVPIAFVFISRPMYERDLRRLGEMHGIPRELGEVPPDPEDEWGKGT